MARNYIPFLYAIILCFARYCLGLKILSKNNRILKAMRNLLQTGLSKFSKIGIDLDDHWSITVEHRLSGPPLSGTSGQFSKNRRVNSCYQ